MKLIHNILENCRTFKFLTALSVISVLSLASCSDNVEPTPSVGPDFESEQNRCSLTIAFPPVGFGDNIFASRADYLDPITGNEGNLHSLYLVIFQEKENEAGEGTSYQFLSVSDLKVAISTLRPSYEYYTLSLEKGNYKFYLLANFLDYWTPDPNNEAEKVDQFENTIVTDENIRSLNLDFNDELIQDGDLPMACMPEEMFADANGTPLRGPDTEVDGETVEGEQGVFVISEDDIKNNVRKQLYAPLSILCSKVRYTILFDNTADGFSKDFPEANVKFDVNVLLTNVIKNTPFKKPEATIENPSFFDHAIPGITMHPAAYPEDESCDAGSSCNKTHGYWNIKDQQSSPSNLGTDNIWNDNSNKRAWQGNILYLPENTEYTAGNDIYTNLHLTATGTGASPTGYNIPLKYLERGHFYDIVAKLTTSSELAVTVSVKVNPWNYKSSEPEIW